MRILFIDSAHPILHQKLQAQGFVCDLFYTLSESEIERTISEYEGIVIRSKIKIGKTLLDKASRLKFIARVGAGMENIDVEYAESRGIACLHAPEGNRDAVAEHALGMLLCLFNNLHKADREVREGKWLREANRGIELNGKTVGIIGYGNMGSAFAERLRGFGVKVLAYDKYKKNFGNNWVEEAELKDITEHADILSIHVPYTTENHYMINHEFLQQFRKSIYIINTARGKVLKTFDLVEEIKSGKVLGACLDVLEYEDLSFEGIQEVIKKRAQPEIEFLLSSDKVLLSPHIAGWTHESNEKLAQVLVDKIVSRFKP